MTTPGSSSSSRTEARPCIACAALVDPQPPPFQHGCCNRYVCALCLAARPRLATFCPLCDDAHAALRKGRRQDVVFQGDVIFDVERAQKDEQMVEEAMGHSGGDPCPPPYVSSDDFRIDDEDEDENKAVKMSGQAGKEGSSSASSLPHLMASSASKAAAPRPELVAHRAAPHRADSKEEVDADKEQEIDASTYGPLGDQGGRTATSALLAVAHFTSQQAPGGSSVRHRSPAASSSRHSVRIHTPPPEVDATTVQYWLRPYDTVQGLSLKFGISVHQLCQLNALSTPHLLHTRPFILLPTSSLPSDDATLASALAGPPPASPGARTRSARRATEARFRALVMRSMRTAGSEVMRPDERAARTYVALVEDELRFVDFGGDKEDAERAARESGRREDKAVAIAEDEDDMDGEDDTARTKRFEAILKLAIARWEMDSEWERQQRVTGYAAQRSGGSAGRVVNPAGWNEGMESNKQSGASLSAVRSTLFPLSAPGQAWKSLFSSA